MSLRYFVVLLCLALQSFATEENFRYRADPKRCGNDGVELINGWMDQVLSWARMAAEAVADDIPNERIRRQYLRMFGRDTAHLVRENYLKLARFSRYDSSYEDWQNDRNMYDVEIQCNSKRIIPNNGYYPEDLDIPYRDPVQNVAIYKDDPILGLKYGLSLSYAITKVQITRPMPNEKWDPKAPEIITFNPLRMKQYKLFKSEFNEELIKKAMHPRIKGTIKIHAPEFIASREWTPVDLLDTPAMTLFHEMTHLESVAGSSDGPGEDEVYGWIKVLENKFTGASTADNLAYFAILVDLILNYGYDVEENGTIFKIE